MKHIGNEPLQKALSRRLRDRGFMNHLNATKICEVAKGFLPEDTDAVSFSNGVLKIRTDSDAQAYIIKIQQAQLIKQINDFFGDDSVKSLRFIIKK